MRKEPAPGLLSAVPIHPRPARALRPAEVSPPLPDFPAGVRVLPLDTARGRRHLALASDGWGLVLGLGAFGRIEPSPDGIPVEWVAEESFAHDLGHDPQRDAHTAVADFWARTNLTLDDPLCRTRTTRFGNPSAAAQDGTLLMLVACAAGLAADRPRVARLTGVPPHPAFPHGGLALDPEPEDPRLAALIRIVGRLVLAVRPHGAFTADLQARDGANRDRLSRALVYATPLLEKNFAPIDSAHGRMACRSRLIQAFARIPGAEPAVVGEMLALGPRAGQAAGRLCAAAAAFAPPHWRASDADLAALTSTA